MRRSLSIFVYLAVSLQAAAASPLFRPVEIPQHIYGGGWEYFVGGGLAVFDCNGDHMPDIYAAGGENQAALLIIRSIPSGVIKFQARTPDALALAHVTGAYPLDIDSDGILDLAILQVGRNTVLKGGPDCTVFRHLGGRAKPANTGLWQLCRPHQPRWAVQGV